MRMTQVFRTRWFGATTAAGSVLALASLIAAAPRAQSPGIAHRIEIEGPHFTVHGKPLQIISGEMHYARIPREYWKDRMQKARAMGLNTISTYVFWNLHEPRPGVYNFSEQLDIAEFVREAQRQGLYVLLRPGPYVCAEWDLGGLPAWLLADPTIVLRSTDPKFIEPATRFLKQLGKELAPLQATHGGPIIGVQIENEYGSFGNDKEYLAKIRDAIVTAGLGEVPLFTADGPVQLPLGTLPDVAAAINFGPGSAQRSFAELERFRPDGLRMNQEYWDGWFDSWGKPHQTTNGDREARELDWMLSQGFSVNLYMFHGGTTFGFMNGANFDRAYSPQTTSYDYNAPLDESGVPSAKFPAFRDVIAKRREGERFPALPAVIPRIEIPDFALDEASSLWANLGTGTTAPAPKPMEMFGQSYGYILYRTTVQGPKMGPLSIHELHDYAQVYVDGKLAGTLDRRFNQSDLGMDLSAGAHTIDILVENSGHINFGPKIRDDRKGITESVSLAGTALTPWKVFRLPMDEFHTVEFAHKAVDGPAFYRGHFTLSQTGDTFFDMQNLGGKGAVWVNGHALGRFWAIGPQQTLYVPGPWLNQGTNQVIVFDLHAHTESPKLRGLANPILNSLAPTGDAANSK
jgi:beta-galactosidase